MFLDELNKSRGIYDFKLWAYVLMPHHVHPRIWPLDHNCDIGKIDSGMNGVIPETGPISLAMPIPLYPRVGVI
jgi:hypothetical protein